MLTTFILCILFTAFFVLSSKYLLDFMDTPKDVFGQAQLYLNIYFAGVSGLLIYNMGSAILRAVGDTVRPLYFLVLTSVLNIFLDLLFVLKFHMGIAGVAYATIIAQFISAFAVMLLLTRTHEIYRFAWRDMKMDFSMLSDIVRIGLPAAIQSIITSFSNVFVQSYINHFGSYVMAGWGSYNKIDQFIMLPMQSMSLAATTFVSQNIGAKNVSRAHKGTWVSILLTLAITGAIAVLIFAFAPATVRLFSSDKQVIKYGQTFLRVNIFFVLTNCISQILAGSLRGCGDSNGPMIIMLLSFVAIRQCYLYIITHYVINTPAVVGFGYPVGWICSAVILTLYYHKRIKHFESKCCSI